MSTAVIDWEGAMEQCGDDEEFLRELLSDLRTETDAQMLVISGAIEKPADSPFVRVLRASHVIKGAAANLMCAQLRLCALQLEMAAQTAANDADGLKNPAVMTELKERHEELKVAVKSYHEYLESIGV